MKRSARKLVQNYILILLGSALYALAFDWCFVPLSLIHISPRPKQRRRPAPQEGAGRQC